MALNSVRLGDHIHVLKIPCGIPNLSNYEVSGINKEKEFFEPSTQIGEDTSKYQIVPPGCFACNIMHVGRDRVLPIALNTSHQNKHVSPAYTVFEWTGDEVLLKEFLFMLLKSPERDRYFWFHCDSSVRDGMDWGAFCDISIAVPNVKIQKKYVQIYQSLLNIQQSVGGSLIELKTICEGLMDDAKRSFPKVSLGRLIQIRDERNQDGALGVNDVRGISIQKKFIPTKADMDGVPLTSYKLVKPGDFAYVPITSRNGDKITIAMNSSDETFLVSGTYIVFSVSSPKELLPDYLFMFFSRPEFDRYSRFHSWGSAREAFSWDEMCSVQIPLPQTNDSIAIQRNMADLFINFKKRSKLNAEMRALLVSLCPVLVNGARM